jgi:IS30 family transposase
LARSHRKRLQRWHSCKHPKNHIPERISITRRPAIIQTRRQFGHWEADTVISRKSIASLLVMVERKSRLVKLAWLPQKSASNTRGNSRLRKCLRFKAPEQVFRLGIALTS